MAAFPHSSQHDDVLRLVCFSCTQIEPSGMPFSSATRVVLGVKIHCVALLWLPICGCVICCYVDLHPPGPEGTSIIVEFVNVLTRCVGVFAYRGKSAIEHDAMHGPIDSSDVKRLLSAQYTGGAMSSVDAHRLSSASSVAGTHVVM